MSDASASCSEMKGVCISCDNEVQIIFEDRHFYVGDEPVPILCGICEGGCDSDTEESSDYDSDDDNEE